MKSVRRSEDYLTATNEQKVKSNRTSARLPLRCIIVSGRSHESSEGYMQ